MTHESVMKGLEEALAIERGETIPQMQTFVSNGVIIEIRIRGETTFKLEDALTEIGQLRVPKKRSIAEFMNAYREIVQQTQNAMAHLYGVDVTTYRNW